jgi:hypothetical protein
VGSNGGLILQNNCTDDLPVNPSGQIERRGIKSCVPDSPKSINKLKAEEILDETVRYAASEFRSADWLASAQHCRKVDVDKSSGFCTVPDPSLTPGEMDPSLACVSNRDRPRAVTDSEKNTILAAYGYPTSTKKSSGESMTGSRTGRVVPTDQRTFGSSRMPAKCGSFAKDKVELLLWRKVCVDKTNDPSKQAKTNYLTSWTKLLPWTLGRLKKVRWSEVMSQIP